MAAQPSAGMARISIEENQRQPSWQHGISAILMARMASESGISGSVINGSGMAIIAQRQLA
jgi:hypothetical protein